MSLLMLIFFPETCPKGNQDTRKYPAITSYSSMMLRARLYNIQSITVNYQRNALGKRKSAMGEIIRTGKETMLTTLRVPAFEDNYIWLIKDSKGPHVAIVDPGDARPVLSTIEKEGLVPVAILITHHHWDHIGGIDGLLARYPMPVYGPAGESIPYMTQPLSEGTVVHIPELNSQFRVLDVPGHTAGHIAYYHAGNDDPGMLFCGDTLFAGGCGRLFEGTPTQMHHSLSKILALPDNTLVFCAHEYTEANLVFARVAEPGNQALQERQSTVQKLRQHGEPTVPSFLGDEKATNPFLRFDEPSIVEAAEGFAGHPLPNAASVFGTIRHWKDTLD